MSGLMDQISGLGGKISEALGLGQNNDSQLSQKLNQLVHSSGGLGGMLGSAALGGVLGTLLSGKTGRRVAGGALMAGGTAAAGVMAWKYFQKWVDGNKAHATAAAGTDVVRPGVAQPFMRTDEVAAHKATAAEPNDSALLLLEAMVFAARADGHIDEAEKANITKAIESLFPNQDVSGVFNALLDKPLDPDDLAKRVHSHEQGCDLYRLSRMIITPDQYMERTYLDGLARALNLTLEERATLDKEAEEAQQSPQSA